MARGASIKLLRTTRANLNTQRAASALIAGEPYLITDEARLAVATSASAYTAAAVQNEDITGSIGTTDNAIPRADGTGGKTLQSSGLQITDADQLLASTSTSTSVPPVSFIGDPDTGLAHPAANIVSLSAGGVELLRVESAGFSAPIPSGSTRYPAFFARAWAKFKGTGTVTLNGSGNVSSITDGGVGLYTVNFTAAMPDANYGAVATAEDSSLYNTMTASCDSFATGSVRVVTGSPTAFQDARTASVAIYR